MCDTNDRQAGAIGASRGAPPSRSLELRIESLQYVAGVLEQQLERFHDPRSLLKQYLSGDLSFHVHGEADGRGWFCETSTRLVLGNDDVTSGVDVQAVTLLKSSFRRNLGQESRSSGEYRLC